MSPTIVRYCTRPDAAAENSRLIEAVFAELALVDPPGLRYAVMQAGDDFLHIAWAKSNPSPLIGLEAFQHFRKDIAGRCIEPPRTVGARIVGNFGALAE